MIDETAEQLIKDKRLNSVSVGVDVKHIERVGEGDDSRLVLTGLKFRELSLVAVGADEGANFEMAVTEAYNIQQKKTEGLNMSNDETKLAEEARKAEEAKKAESARLAEEAKAAEAKKTNDLAIKETNDRLKIAEEKIKAYEAKERKTLEENYAKLCEKKGAKALDVKEMESKMIETLMKQIETVTETESSDETENEIKVGEKFKVVQCAGSLNGGAFTLERC